MKPKQPSASKTIRTRQIVGFSLPPQLAAEVKLEAARRNIRLRKLFTELWTLYKKSKPAKLEKIVGAIENNLNKLPELSVRKNAR